MKPKSENKVLPAVTGRKEDDPEGEKIKERRGEIFRERYLPGLRPIPHHPGQP